MVHRSTTDWWEFCSKDPRFGTSKAWKSRPRTERLVFSFRDPIANQVQNSSEFKLWASNKLPKHHLHWSRSSEKCSTKISLQLLKEHFPKCPYEIFLKLPLNMDTWPCLTASLIGVQIWISNWTWIWPILVCHIWFKFTFLIWIHHCWLVQPSSLTESSCLLVLQKRLQLVYMGTSDFASSKLPKRWHINPSSWSKVVVVVPGYIRNPSSWGCCLVIVSILSTNVAIIIMVIFGSSLLNFSWSYSANCMSDLYAKEYFSYCCVNAWQSYLALAEYVTILW